MLNTQPNSANDMNALKVLLTLLGVLLISMQFVSAADAEGWLDVIRPDRYATGWAIDSDYSGATEVHFYVDGTDPNTHFAGAVSANEYSQDVLDQGFGNGNNRFYFLIPDKYRDGQQHTLRAYAIGKDADGSNSDRNIELQGSPKTFTFSPQYPGGNPGDQCTPSGTCAPGVTCDSDNICRQYNGLNGACGTNAKCLSPYVCTSSTGLGTCKVPVGGSCTSSNECYPVYHYTSDGQSSLYGDCTSSGVCSNTVYPTYSCQGPFPPAGTYSACSNNAAPTSNQGSTLLSSSSQCSSTASCQYTCNSGYYSYGGSCHAKKADNAYCAYGYECAGGQCAGGYCSTPITTMACPSPPSGNGVRLIQSLKPEGSTVEWTYIEPTFVGPTGWCTWTCNAGYYQNGNTCSSLNSICNSTFSCGTHTFSGNTVQLSCMDNDNNGVGVCRVPTSSLCPTSVSNACLNGISCVDTNNDGIGLCTTPTTTVTCPSTCTNGCIAGTTTCNPPGVISTPTCTSFTYTEFGGCFGGQQARSVISSSPSGCTGGSPITFRACVDTFPPSAVSNLNVIPGTTTATVSWTNPIEPDFLRVLIFLNNINVANLTGTSYTLTSLQQNTTYNITVRTMDTLLNINTTLAPLTFTTLATTSGGSGNGTGPGNASSNDTIPPAAVTNLRVTSLSDNSIIWAWNNPSNPDFQATILIFNNVNVLNTSSNTFTALGLGSGTSYTLTVFTRDTSGNINQTGVSSTVTTTGGSPGAGSGSSSDDDDDDGSSSGSPRRSSTANTVSNPDRFSPSSTDEDTIYLDSPSSTTKYSTSFLGSKAFLWTLFALCVVLAVGVIAALNYRRG